MRRHCGPGQRGFTLIELVIVMAMLGLLLSLALPSYMAALAKGREKVQQENLALMREAIDKFYGDNGRYPQRLEDLVSRRYLRAIPLDPVTEARHWQVVPPNDQPDGGVFDVRALAPAGHANAPLPVAPADAEPDADADADAPADTADGPPGAQGAQP